MAATEVKDGPTIDGEMEEETPRLVHKLHIKVGDAKSLHGLKGNNVISFVKLEFGTTVIGESPKCENDAVKGVTSFDFECNMTVNVNEPTLLDDFVQSPIVLSVIEILPKDRKAKEEKTNVIGQACIDALPFLKGAKTMSLTMTLYPPIPLVEAATSEAQPFPEVEVNLSVTEPLFSNEQLKTTNMMTIGVENLYSVPEQWNATTGSQFMYFAALPIPISAQKEVVVVIPGGTFRTPGEKEQMNNRKWCSAPTATGACLYMPERPIVKYPRDLDEGDFQSKSELSFRDEAENDKIHVAWNMERRCFFNKAASENFMKKIAQHRIWPLEVFRTLSNPASKTKGKGEEDLSFHGIVYVDMAPLLYPGVKKIHGAYLIKPYDENEIFEKTGRRSTSIDESVKVSLIARSSNTSVLPSKAPGAKAGKLDSKPKPSAAVLKPTEPAVDQENNDVKKIEGQFYVDAHSYIVVDFELDVPLVPKREPSVLAQKVLDLIPPRPLFSKKEGGAKKAIEGFQNQIGITAHMLLDDFQKMFSSQIDSEDENGADRRKQEFLYHLNASGKYFAMKEQLKYCVIKIVREKYMKKMQFTSNTELQEFISQLYDFLIAQMHGGLKNFLTKEETIEIPPPIRDSDVMRFFAKEAESLFDYTLAAKYYQERIALNKDDTEHWLDYGCFCLYIDDLEKATECFKEVVSINQKHLAGLIMNGAVALMKDDFSAAEVFYESSTYSNPTNEIVWTTLGLFYAGIQNDIMAERAFNEAKRLCDPASALKKSYVDTDIANDQENHAQLPNGYSKSENNYQMQQSDTGKDSEKHPDTEPKKKVSHSIYLRTTKFLLEHRALGLAERALSHELTSSGESAHYFQLLAEFYLLMKEYEKAKVCVESCLKDQHQNPDAWTLLGHLYFLTGDKIEARKAYERTLSYCDDAEDVHTLYLRLALIYLEADEFSKAKDIYLTACARKPSCMTWLGAGISFYRLGTFSDAEHALQEANILDNHNTMVWSYLTLVCLQQKRHLEAEQCYKFALKTGPINEQLKDEIKSTMQETGFDLSLLPL